MAQHYDIIGDIHGYADALEGLLRKLGYEKHRGVYRHDSNKAFFLGDFIDRGPQQRRVLDIVMPMVSQGHALSVMGNHEFNAICYATLDREGRPLRKHSDKNVMQHRTFLETYPLDEERMEIINWFKTLPIYVETDDVRIVHASWNDQAISDLATYIDEGKRLKESAYVPCSNKSMAAYRAIETLLKGPEAMLPEGVTFNDNDGVTRKKARVKWWLPQEMSTQEKLHLGTGLNNGHKINKLILDDGYHYKPQNKPLFVGHYWLNDKKPVPLSNNVVCVDYSIAKSGKLVVYQWREGEALNESGFRW